MRIRGLLFLPVACAAKGASRPSPSDDIREAGGTVVDSSLAIDSSGTADDGESGGSAEGSLASCAGLPLCDGFESEAPGTPPDPTRWTVLMGCNPNTPNAPVMGGLTVGIDATVAHGGKNSLRVVGGDSCGDYAVNTSAFGLLTASSPIYARFFARFSGKPTPNHNGFVSMVSGGAANFLSAYSNRSNCASGFKATSSSGTTYRPTPPSRISTLRARLKARPRDRTRGIASNFISTRVRGTSNSG